MEAIPIDPELEKKLGQKPPQLKPFCIGSRRIARNTYMDINAGLVVIKQMEMLYFYLLRSGSAQIPDLQKKLGFMFLGEIETIALAFPDLFKLFRLPQDTYRSRPPKSYTFLCLK